MQKRDLPYSASISTNGVLLNSELFDLLLDAGVVSYQISIDGARELHDSQRVTASGKPTFEKILGNLRMMAATNSQFSCILRCNSHRSKFPQVWKLFDGPEMDFIRADERFVVDLHEIWESDRQDVRAAVGDEGCIGSFTKGMDFHLFNRMLQDAGFSSVSYRRLPDALAAGCYAGKPNWFVVGPDLKLYKCTVVFENEKNHVGYLTGDGELHIDEVKNTLWTGSSALTDRGCAGCHYRIPCGGIACPLTRFTSGSKACPSIRNPSNLRRWADSYPLRKAEAIAI